MGSNEFKWVKLKGSRGFKWGQEESRGVKRDQVGSNWVKLGQVKWDSSWVKLGQVGSSEVRSNGIRRINGG